MLKRTTPLLLAAFLVAACGSSTEPSIDMDGKAEVAKGDAIDGKAEVCTPECADKECGDNGCGGACGTCEAWLQCNDADQCSPAPCVSSIDCPGQLVCEETLGQCVVCVQDGDCAEGETCGPDYFCHGVLPCTSDKDCKDFGLLCDLDAGVCVQCLKSAHCAEDEYCQDSYCLPDVCIAGESWCEENQVLACSDDGGAVGVVETCDAEQYCEEAGCHDYLCEPASAWCEADVLKTCSEDGKAVVSEVDCSAGEQHCFDGQCIDSVCVPEGTKCSDDFTVGVCDADGMGFAEELCPAEQYCEGGECFPWLCTPAASYCDGDVAKTCDEKGSAVADAVDCGSSGKYCSDGQCVDCEPLCEGKSCGDDGCGGSCGECANGVLCQEDQCTGCDDGNDVDWDGCSNGKITEFQVNTTAPNEQRYPSVDQLLNGAIVVVWDADDLDGDSSGVFAQIFDEMGQPAGGEFLVNTYTDASQRNPAVVALSDGNFVVVWEGAGESPYDGLGISAQVFQADGTKVESQFIVNSFHDGEQRSPAVSSWAAGGFVVVWDGGVQDGDSWGVFGQRLANDGTKVGDEFQANTFTEYDQFWPTVAATADGGSVVLWQSGTDQDGDDWGIIGQRFGPDGSPVDTEFVANSWTEDSQQHPAAVAMPDGGFVVAWDSHYQDGDKGGVFGQLFDGNGAMKGDEFQANTYTADVQVMPQVDAFPDGSFIVVWNSNPQDGSKAGVVAQRFGPDGAKVGEELLVNTYIDHNQNSASVAAFQDVGFIIVWCSVGQDGSGSGIFAQRFDADGNKLYH